MKASLWALGLLFTGAPAWVEPAEPPPAEVRVKGPEGNRIRLRLVFRKGPQAETSGLPSQFLARGKGPWSSFDELTPEGKRWLLESLWPEDEWGDEAILHRVRWPELESVWLMASLFTGHGQNYDPLMQANPKNAEKLRKGDLWRVPRHLLSIDLGGRIKGVIDQARPEDELDDEARVAAFRQMLSFDQDERGRYAAYRLRKGEALYSSVVMRFTDRVDPKEVNELALEIAKRSGIADVRSIQPGTLIRIPVEALADPFQTEGSTALAEERELRAEVRRTSRIEAGPRLKGVRIVLDAGHGGADPGAMANGVWESDFVYDIAMRVRRSLEQDTEAQVSSTIRYPATGFKVRDRILTVSRDAEILTTPPFANDGDSPNAVSVHLRWVLANDLFSSFARKGDPQKTLFISFHADSLHPSARGTMIYAPGAALVPASFTLPASRGARVAEMKRSAKVSFTGKERLRSEARSRLFSEGLLKALRAEKVPIHANRPIRSVIHRGGKSFVPAVISHSNAATKVLVEVANLANEEDAASLQDPAFRERYAQAVVRGIRAFYRK